MAVTWGDAQAAVIGAGLIDPECVPEILAELRPEDFSGACVRYYEAFRDLTAEKRPVDPVVVIAKIGEEYRDMTKDLMIATPTAAHVQDYIRICREQRRLDQLRRVGAQLMTADSLDEARELAKTAAELSIEKTADRIVTAMEVAADWINRMNAQEKPEYVTTGFGCLDGLIHTVPGNYHVIGGYTSHGKSALAFQIALHIAQTKKVGYFSFEMPERDYKDRLVTLSSGVDQAHVRAMDLAEDELQATVRGAAKLFGIKDRISYIPASGSTVEDIRLQTIRNGFEVIFVDYLQNVVPLKSQYDRFRGVTEISRGLQELAQSLGVVVFAMSQMSRPSDEETFLPVPPLSSLRESGQIEQDADAVIMVHAPLRLKCPRFRVLDVAKNRTGPIERFFIGFDGPKQTFSAPSLEEHRTWTEMMKKRRLLTAEEHQAIREKVDADQKVAMEHEQRKRHAKAEDGGGEQMQMEEQK